MNGPSGDKKCENELDKGVFVTVCTQLRQLISLPTKLLNDLEVSK